MLELKECGPPSPGSEFPKSYSPWKVIMVYTELPFLVRKGLWDSEVLQPFKDTPESLELGLAFQRAAQDPSLCWGFWDDELPDSIPPVY